MPRNKRHGNVTDQSDTLTNDQTATEHETVTTATDTPAGLSFDFVVESAPPDYEPERKNPGRTRTPSPFDSFLIELKDKGWQRVPYQGDEMKQAVLRELAKAKQYHGLGLDLNVTDTHVEWKSRDLQKRKPRKKNADGSEALAANQEANGGLDPDGDNDE